MDEQAQKKTKKVSSILALYIQQDIHVALISGRRRHQIKKTSEFYAALCGEYIVTLIF
jgi:hypothetical protein